MKRITQFILCIVLAVSAYGQGVGGNSVPRTVSGISAALDLISSTQGTVFYRGASGWEALPPGTSGQLFSTQGAAANPIWVTATGGAGDVNGPTLGTATDNAIVRFDGTGGKTVQNSAVTIADTTGSISINGTDTATAVNTGGFKSANFGLSTVSGGASYFGGVTTTAINTGGNALVQRLSNVGGNSILELVGGTAAAQIIGNTAGALYFFTGSATPGTLGTQSLLLQPALATLPASLAVQGTTSATNTTSGALVVGANVGLSGNAGGASYFGGAIRSGASGTVQGQLTVYSGDTGSAEGNISGRAGGGLLLNTNGNNYPITLNGSGVSLAPTPTATSTVSVPGTLSSGASTSGAFRVGDGTTAATNVAIGGGNINAGGTITGASLATGQTPSASVATASTHKVAIVLNGVTYYMLLTNVP